MFELDDYIQKRDMRERRMTFKPKQTVFGMERGEKGRD